MAEMQTHRKSIGRTLLSLVVAVFFCASLFQYSFVYSATSDGEVADNDYEKYLKYDKYLKYTKRKKYRKYKKAKKKYGFDSSAEKFKAKACYKVIKGFKKTNPVMYATRKAHPCYYGYKDYRRYKKYYKPVKKYKKYKKYDRKEYNRSRYKKYGASSNKAAYKSWKKTHRREANLGGSALGPKISIGLHEFTRNELRDDSFRITAYKASTGDPISYKIKDKNNSSIISVGAGEQTRVKYNSKKTLRIYNYDSSQDDEEKILSKEVRFTAKNSSDVNDIFFKYSHDEIATSYVKYRDNIKLRYYDASGSDRDRIWVINYLPLEHYVWGMGEITGTGDRDYNRVMTISYRTYGYWKIKYSTKYASRGFKVNATPGNQLYYGYVWETKYARIKKAAKVTRGKIVMYGHRIAITPYSSWTDGRTRSFEERWGSKNYPWCKSVKDPYGKHPSKSTSRLVSEGNHMVGLSAHGALDRADHGGSYSKIIKYYYTNVDIYRAY